MKFFTVRISTVQVPNRVLRPSIFIFFFSFWEIGAKKLGVMIMGNTKEFTKKKFVFLQIYKFYTDLLRNFIRDTIFSIHTSSKLVE